MDSARRAIIDPWLELDAFDRPSRFMDQYLGSSGWDADDFVLPRHYSRLYRPRVPKPNSWNSTPTTTESGAGTLSKDMFSVKLDVHQFHPEEVQVKTKDNSLIIEARHEEREDAHGFIARHFSRRYILPDDAKVEQLVCNMSTDGIITIEAPRKSAQPGGETVIPIRQTGRPAPVPPAPTATATATASSNPSTLTSSTVPTGAGAPRESKSQTIQIERDAPSTNSA